MKNRSYRNLPPAGEPADQRPPSSEKWMYSDRCVLVGTPLWVSGGRGIGCVQACHWRLAGNSVLSGQRLPYQMPLSNARNLSGIGSASSILRCLLVAFAVNVQLYDCAKRWFTAFQASYGRLVPPCATGPFHNVRLSTCNRRLLVCHTLFPFCCHQQHMASPSETLGGSLGAALLWLLTKMGVADKERLSKESGRLSTRAVRTHEICLICRTGSVPLVGFRWGSRGWVKGGCVRHRNLPQFLRNFSQLVAPSVTPIPPPPRPPCIVPSVKALREPSRLVVDTHPSHPTPSHARTKELAGKPRHCNVCGCRPAGRHRPTGLPAPLQPRGGGGGQKSWERVLTVFSGPGAQGWVLFVGKGLLLTTAA